MRRRAARIDGNQPQIVKALRARGASVDSLGAAGGGIPDLLVGFLGVNLLMEVKDPENAKLNGEIALDATGIDMLTPEQREWHATWRGQVHIVEGIDGAMALLDKIEAVSRMPGGPLHDKREPGGFEPPKPWEPGT